MDAATASYFPGKELPFFLPRSVWQGRKKKGPDPLFSETISLLPLLIALLPPRGPLAEKVGKERSSQFRRLFFAICFFAAAKVPFVCPPWSLAEGHCSTRGGREGDALFSVAHNDATQGASNKEKDRRDPHPALLAMRMRKEKRHRIPMRYAAFILRRSEDRDPPSIYRLLCKI